MATSAYPYVGATRADDNTGTYVEPVAAGRRRAHRSHLLVLGALMALALLRGLFWVAAHPAPWLDEIPQFSYVESVATGHGIPVTGKSLVSDDALRLAKGEPTQYERTAPLAPRASAGWGFVSYQYEGVQAPLYYLLMVPVYWLAHPGGLLAVFYAIRIASLFLTLLALPLIYLLGRELFPARPAIWLSAPACLVALDMVSAAASLVDNDAATVAVGALCLLALLRLRRDFSIRRCAWFGATLGLCVLTKATATELLPVVMFGLIAAIWSTKPLPRQLLVGLAAAGGLAALLVAPWLAFNESVYGAISGAKFQAAEVGPVLVASGWKVPAGLSGFHMLATEALNTLFNSQDVGITTYRYLWDGATIFAISGGLIATGLRRRWRDLRLLAWLSAAVPLGMFAFILTDFLASGASTQVVGRHFGMLVPIFCVLLSAGAVTVFGPRLGVVALIVFLVAVTWVEIPQTQNWARGLYTTGIIGQSVPVIEQSYSNGQETAGGVAVNPSCPATYIALVIEGRPSAVEMNGRPLNLVAGSVAPWDTYELPTAEVHPFMISFSSPQIIAVAHGINLARASVIRESTDAAPVLRVYCREQSPAAYRFHQLYDPNHPYPFSLTALIKWPKANAALGTVFGAITIIAMGLRRPRPAGAHSASSTTFS